MLGIFLFVSSHLLRAVEYIPTGTFVTSAPTNTNIQDWQTGWTQPTVQPTGTTTYTTGWNYVGSVSADGGASAVYLGNGWFVTASHVASTGGSLDVTLNGTVYPFVSSSTQTLTTAVTTTTVSSTGTTTTTGASADLTLFRVSPAPALPPLPIRSSTPVEGISHIVMIGFGDGGSHINPTWGYDLVNSNVNVAVPLYSWVSNDFETSNGTNVEYELVGGDSGGADFIYNSTLSRWELAGINEAELTNNDVQVGSAFIQLNNSTFSTTYAGYPATGDTTTFTGTATYATQIDGIIAPTGVDTPAMPTWALVSMGMLLLGIVARAKIMEGRAPARP